MTTDSPDWYTRTEAATLRATSIQGGLDADKSASPVAEDVYLARDTGILYVCFVSGTWTNIGTLYLLKAGGTMSGAIVFAAAQTGTYLLLAGGTMSGAIAMGTNKITGMGDPTLAQDAATRAYVLAQASAKGSYAGNSSVNKVVAHGLGISPSIVLIWDDTGGNTFYRILGGVAKVLYATAAEFGGHAVTAPDSTNFYVGNATSYTQSANLTGRTYYWVAVK